MGILVGLLAAPTRLLTEPMAYDEGLAERIRSTLDGESESPRRRCSVALRFSGRGKMFVGIVKTI